MGFIGYSTRLGDTLIISLGICTIFTLLYAGAFWFETILPWTIYFGYGYILRFIGVTLLKLWFGISGDKLLGSGLTDFLITGSNTILLWGD